MIHLIKEKQTYVKNIIEFNSIGTNKNIKPFNFFLNLKKYITNPFTIKCDIYNRTNIKKLYSN